MQGHAWCPERWQPRCVTHLRLLQAVFPSLSRILWLSTFCLFVHSCILDLRVKKKVSLDYNFVAFEPSLSSKLVLRAATYNGDWFYQTLTPLSKEAFLTDILEMENLMVRFTC